MSIEIISHLGIQIPIDPEIVSPIIADRIRRGLYEHKEAKQIVSMIQPGERILEIGGGIGFTSTLCSKNINTAAVRVFEANPSLLPYIKEVYALNNVGKVEVVNGVLINGAGPETLDFYLRTHFWASSLSPQPGDYASTVAVPTRNFSREIEEFRPSLIICDIEGGEVELFKNADLSGVKRVFMEVHPKVVGKRGMKNLFDSFSARNFCYEPQFSSGAVVMFSHFG